MQDSAHVRTAFTAVLLLDRRKQQPGNGASITAVAVDLSCQRLYVGLEDGWLEEHTIVRSATGVGASLAARKHAAKKAILDIHALPDQGLVVLLNEDGLVQLLDSESLEGRLLPVRHALATCVATPPGRLPRLAVATKPSSRSMRFLVYELPPSSSSSGTTGGGHPHPPQLLAQAEVPDSSTAVHGMGWVGGHLAVCCGVRYLLVAPFDPPPPRGAFGGSAGGQWRELFSVPDELAYWPAMLTTMPDLGRALLVVGPAGIIVDAGGNPVGSALRLEGLGATPRALAAAGPFLLLVSEAGIHVFDRQSGGEVQRLAFAADLRPLPAQPLFAAASGDGAAPAAGESGSGFGSESGSGLSTLGGGSGGGGCVAVAGRRVIWLCLPVAPADQAWELLAQGDFEAALDLIEGGLAQGAEWAQVAAAQAALLLLHECRVEEAVRCLEQCSPATFQPAQLFPLFPSYTAPWAHQVPTHQRYWGLAAPLPSLESLIGGKLHGGQRQQEGGGGRGSGGSSGWRTPPRIGGQHAGSSRSSSLFALDESSGGGGSPANSSASLGRQGRQSGKQQQLDGDPSKGRSPGSQQEGASPPAATAATAAAAAAEAEPGLQAPQNGASQQLPGTSGEAVHSKQRQQEDPARRRLQRQAWESLAQYLFRVRMLDGVACLPGVDTLLLLLLADLADARQVAAFSAVPNQAHVPSVQPRLQAEQWHHALATLHAARGHADVALHTWRQVADGQLAAPADPALQAAERREAIESAAALLRDPAACPESTLVGYIPWLLAASQPAALEVLTARSLTPAAVLPLLPEESDVRWQYLAHLVGMEAAAGTAGTAGAAGTAAAAAGDPALHTELAIQLVAAIFRAGPELRIAALPGSSACAARSLSVSRRASEAGAGGGGNGNGGSMVPQNGSAQGRRRPSRTSTAALVSGGSLEVWPGATPAQAMRLRLRGHLQHSSFYDADAVLGRLRGTGLVEELVVVHSKVGDHMAAMRLLALTLRDVAAAVAYARAHLAPADYRALLHLVLEPGPGLEPRWEDACYLITALGDHLDPQEVLQALPAGMPLASAAGVLGPMLRDRLHRRRQGVMLKNLHRARLAVATGAMCDAQSQHVTVGEDRACPHCHLRLGGKVFVVLQPGMLPPGGGEGPPAAAAGSSSGSAGRGGGSGGSGAGTGTASNQQQDEAGEADTLRPPGEDSLAAAAQRQQQLAAGGQEPQVLCYACYRRLFPQAAGRAAAGGAATAGAGATPPSGLILT